MFALAIVIQIITFKISTNFSNKKIILDQLPKIVNKCYLTSILKNKNYKLNLTKFLLFEQ